MYPLSMIFFHSTGFSLDAEQSVLHGMLVIPRIKSLVPCLRESTPESWRTMSHDAQVNTWKEFCQGLFYRYLNFM